LLVLLQSKVNVLLLLQRKQKGLQAHDLLSCGHGQTAS
jgi:hypothetical protein